MTNQRLTVADLRGVFVMMPTPATPDAAAPDVEFTVDLDETERAVRTLIADDVDGIMLNGTFGEGPTLTDREWREFTRTAVEAGGGEVPIIAGPTTLDTRTTIERAEFARDCGADGLLLGRPMWSQLSDEATVSHYRAVVAAVPDMGIVLYDNPGAFKGRLSMAVWEELASIPQVVGAKFLGLGLRFNDVTMKHGDRLRVMPIDKDWYPATAWHPDETLACWSVSASCGPLPVTRLRDAIMENDDGRAKALTSRIVKLYESHFPRSDPGIFQQYNIPLEKTRVNAAAYIDAGPCRLPYVDLPAEYEEHAIEEGQRWNQLVSELE